MHATSLRVGDESGVDFYRGGPGMKEEEHLVRDGVRREGEREREEA